MKFYEKMQCKIRNYLYDRDRKRMYSNQDKNKYCTSADKESKKESLLSFFDEMEDYLEKQVESTKNK